VTSPSDQPAPALGTALASAAAVAGFILIFIEAGSFGSEARLFPRLIALLGGISALVLLARTCFGALSVRSRAKTAPAESSLGWRDYVISYVGPPLYAVVLYLAGFWIASIACLVSLMLLLGERRRLLILAITAGTLLTIYVVFDFGFNIRMPKGLLIEMIRG
jgi:drug/metabolite transporter (DMT)-like permease